MTTSSPKDATRLFEPWVELSIVAAALLAVTWLMLWVAGAHTG
jgi:hypothetical protein